ncbi:hypothetical protein BKI52_03015 [marine bacterium AO1-C]|nr:hypothetical protein BKI52_03015 [marine bacterium AO1-C]
MNKFSPNFEGNETALPSGLLYTPQDNYSLVELSDTKKEHQITHLYSDGATSCIILIVVGQQETGNTQVGLAHLSKQESFETFFRLIEQRFRGNIAVYAQGANPPEENHGSDNRLTNERILREWVADHSSSVSRQTLQITQQVLALGEGNPLEANRDCLGIDLKTLQVSNQRLPITTQRDEYNGLQTLYSLFGQELQTPLMLRSIAQPFTQEQITELVTLAFHYNWIDILEMSDEEMLYYFSTTPQYEVPWFCDSLRQSALYVQNHLHLIV